MTYRGDYDSTKERALEDKEHAKDEKEWERQKKKILLQENEWKNEEEMALWMEWIDERYEKYGSACDDEDDVELWEIWLRVRKEWLDTKKWYSPQFDDQHEEQEEWTEEEIARFNQEFDDADDNFDPLDEEVRLNILKEEQRAIRMDRRENC